MLIMWLRFTSVLTQEPQPRLMICRARGAAISSRNTVGEIAPTWPEVKSGLIDYASDLRCCNTKFVAPHEEFISWQEMWNRMYPMAGVSPEDDVPSGDHYAAEMNRLRGVAIVQAAETEAVLAVILRHLDPSANCARPAGILMAAIKKRLDPHILDRWSQEICAIDEAIKRRNRLVHDTVTIGYSWRDYATGGSGEHVPVISLLGHEDMDEFDLRNVLDLQREATEFVIKVLHFLTHCEGEPEEAQYCRTCMETKEGSTDRQQML